MASFWLGTCEVNPAVPPTGSVAEPIVAPGASTLAIEVIKEDKDLAVLFSAADSRDHPETLACRIGFANAATACSAWRDRGFPLVDATIEYDGDALRVLTAYFADPETMQYGDLLISIAGIHFEEYGSEQLTAHYEQAQQAPDSAWPATYIRRRPVRWEPGRSRVTQVAAGPLRLDVKRTRCPSLRPFEPGDLRVAKAWSGVLHFPTEPIYAKGKPERVSRADTFGVPAFRFEDVEVIGFRIDLGHRPGLDEDLARLIEPLNFHLEPAQGQDRISDFRYLPATRTVLVELLRYGRMKLKTQESPLTVLDYQSQHELLVRVLVGRVDDDTAQAHDPAIFVPAIFVDNPWSKVLGRDVQGFGKRMADFCIDEGSNIRPLRPDGCLPGEKQPRSLGSISSIRLVNRTSNAARPSGPPILDIDCSPETHSNWDAFRDVDLGLALGTFSLVDTRWRQTDFDRSEFRRAFARDAVRQALRGFRSVQVSPVGNRGLDKTWITGAFTVDDHVRMVNPKGGARLTFRADPAAPGGWRNFCEVLEIPEGESATHSFQTGSWYRLNFSMSMTVDDGLEWA